ATRGLLGEEEFARVKPGSFFVNTARYGIAAEEPLLAALKDGRLAAAAFDHFENEFLSPEHPLASMPNVVLTPHIGGSTIETIDRDRSLARVHRRCAETDRRLVAARCRCHLAANRRRVPRR